MDTTPQLNLAHLIGAVRTELETAETQRRSTGAPPLLQLSELGLELNFVVTRSTTGTGGIDLKVLSLGGEKAVEREQVQKVCLKFSLAANVLNTNVPGSRFSGETDRARENTDITPLE